MESNLRLSKMLRKRLPGFSPPLRFPPCFVSTRIRFYFMKFLRLLMSQTRLAKPLSSPLRSCSRAVLLFIHRYTCSCAIMLYSLFIHHYKTLQAGSPYLLFGAPVDAVAVDEGDRGVVAHVALEADSGREVDAPNARVRVDVLPVTRLD